jgi:nucleoside-diphosphate-sugar epimerase
MNPVKLSCRRWPAILLLVSGWLLTALALHAQSATTGSVQGRVYNPAAKEYIGNAEVRRDFTDVRDVVRAYRLLIEEGTAGRLGDEGRVVNVASGRSVAIRSLIERLCALGGCKPNISIDESLVRHDDSPEIRGDAALLRRLTGWAPQIPLDQTLADVLEEASSEPR